MGMLELLKNWKGAVEINGTYYDDINRTKTAQINEFEKVHIKLLPKVKQTVTSVKNGENREIKVTVKKYMTEKASPEFDFMKKWNNDIPMPLRTMVGEKVKETRGMVYMKLHGDIYADRICTCMKCGRALTNPVSQYFGIGPECGNHNYVNPFNSEEELKEAVSAYKKQLQQLTWEGWIIKSSLLQFEEITNTEEEEVNG